MEPFDGISGVAFVSGGPPGSPYATAAYANLTDTNFLGGLPPNVLQRR
jgi:hypothetical protein